MENETTFIPDLVTKPDSVYEDEQGNYRFRPFDDLAQQYDTYYETAELLYRMLDEPEEEFTQAESEYLKLLSNQKKGEASEEEVNAANKKLKDSEEYLKHKGVVINDTIDSLLPVVDFVELHKRYHDEYVEYVRYQNQLAIRELQQSREEYLEKIKMTLCKLNKSTAVRQSSGQSLSGIHFDDRIYYSIMSPIPDDIQFGLTDQEIKEIRNHDVFYPHEKSFLAEP